MARAKPAASQPSRYHLRSASTIVEGAPATPAPDVRVYGAGDAYYYRNYFTSGQADDHYARLQRELDQLYVPREEMVFRIYGRVIPLPRDKAFLGQVQPDGTYPLYRYNKGGDYPAVRPWTPTTETIRDALAQSEGQVANHLVANRYRTQDDYIGFHQDKTRDFAEGSAVLTVSFGETRMFRLQHMATKVTETLYLEHGSLFVLGPYTNAAWKHSIVKTKSACNERISLTYRTINTSYNPSTGDIVTC